MAAALIAANATVVVLCKALARSSQNSLIDPEEAAEQAQTENQAYISANEAVAKGFRDSSIDDPGASAVTDFFLTEHADLMSKGGLPRIYKAGEWEDFCDNMKENLGYTYSLEHWFRRMVEHTPMLVHDFKVADFVLLPLCPTSFFYLMQAKLVVAGGQSRYLLHQGRLQEWPVMKTDGQYLLQRFDDLAFSEPGIKDCLGRPSCRLLLPCIYGRHVWQNFSSMLGEKLVLITHAGLSDWPWRQRDRPLRWTEGPNSQMRALRAADGHRPSAWNTETSRMPGPPGCRAACAEHCRMRPAGLLRNVDVVLPWPVSFRWEPRSSRTAGRDVMAFFVGTLNSCSRARLVELFRSHFDAALQVARCDLASGTSSAVEGLASGTLLIIPPEHRIHQSDWSQLALRSTFCVVPEGDSPNTGRLVEVIMHGCVPVIVTHRLHPPFAEYLDWESFALFVREDDIEDLPELLASITPRHLRSMQRRLAQAAYYLDYSRQGLEVMILMSLRRQAMQLRASDPDTAAADIYY